MDGPALPKEDSAISTAVFVPPTTVKFIGDMYETCTGYLKNAHEPVTDSLPTFNTSVGV